MRNSAGIRSWSGRVLGITLCGLLSALEPAGAMPRQFPVEESPGDGAILLEEPEYPEAVCTDLCAEPSSGLFTDKMGLTTTTTVSLGCSYAPCVTQVVQVRVTVDDTTKGWVRGPYDDFFKNSVTLWFYPGDVTSLTLEIQGKDDHVSRSDAPYSVILDAISADPHFNGKRKVVSVHNVDRTDYNACVPDVECSFFGLGPSSDHLYVRASNMPNGEYWNDFPTTNHIEGVARLKNDPYVAMTGTGQGDSHLFLARLPEMQINTGCWTPNYPPAPDNGIVNFPSHFIIDPLHNYKHAGALSVFGDFAAIPLEAPSSTVWPRSRVAFFDLSDPAAPALQSAQILRPEYTKAGAAGVAKLQDGRYVVAVQSDCPAEIQFYVSDGTPIVGNPTFTKTYAYSTYNYPEDFPSCSTPVGFGQIQNVNLVQQCGSEGLYMIVTWVTQTVPEGTNRARLYLVQPRAAGNWMGSLLVTRVGTINLPQDSFYSFAAAGGTYVTADGQLSLYGTNANRGTDPAQGAIIPMIQFCALDTPTSLLASQGTFADRVRLSWTAVAGASSYRLLRNGVQIANPVSASYDDLSPGCGQFTYTVQALNCNGQASGASASAVGWISATPPDNIPFGPPLVSPADGARVTPPVVALDWDGVCLAQTYSLEVATSPSFAPGTIVYAADGYPSTQTFGWAPIALGAQYYWHVRAVTAQGVLGNWSVTRSFHTLVPTVPVDLEAGYGHSVSVHADGTVWAWGMNTMGQLADGTTTNRNAPVRAGSLTNVVAVAAGIFHTAALRQDGTVWTWGGNTDGQLGDGTTTPRSVPAAVSGLTGIVALASGANFTLALENDGTVWSWGDNSVGQLGDGTTVDRPTAVRVTGLSEVASIGAGYLHAAAIKSDGSVWTWGSNVMGQLGNGGQTNRSVAGVVPGLAGAVRVSGGGYFTLALLQDGTVRAWGHNYHGQLGDGTDTTRTTPVPVAQLSGVTSVAAGAAFSLAVRSDGTVWSWGQNVAGQLGDGTTTNRSTPAQVAGLSGVTSVAAGEDHSLARKSNGQIFGWGSNAYGQVGSGPSPQRTPVFVSDQSTTPPLGLMYPTGGEQWQPGTPQLVRWTGAGPINVQMSHDGGTTWSTVASSTSLQDVPIQVPSGWTTARGHVRIVRVGSPPSTAQTGSYLRIFAAQQHPWLATTVDGSPGVAGELASMALDPWGRASIAYFDRTHGVLKFARRHTSPDGTMEWWTETVDGAVTSGWFPSLVFGSDGNAHISYVDGTRLEVRYARRVGHGWQTEDVTGVGCTLKTSLALDSQGQPFIALADCNSTRVRLLAKAPSWVEVQAVDGASPSLRIHDDHPSISFFLHNTNPTELHYLRSSGPYGYWTWTNEAIPNTAGADVSSLAIDSAGTPRISFYSTTTRSLRMAKKTGGVWSVETVDASTGDNGAGNSIALDSLGRPRISYLANGLPKVAEWDGSAWRFDVADGAVEATSTTSLAADDAGNLRIAYFDAANGNPKYAISQPDVAAPATPTLIGAAGKTTAVLTWSGTGDDGASGIPWNAEVRISGQPIDELSFPYATVIQSNVSPESPDGCASAASLNPCSPYYFAIRVVDDVGNDAPLATSMVVTRCSGSLEFTCP